MKKQKHRTYKTERGAQRYAAKLSAQYPGKIFEAIQSPKLGEFRFVVGYLLPDNRYALCA